MYNHQYMANITAPSSESVTTYNAYNKNGFLDLPFEFSLPIFNNMQEKYDRPGGNITTVEKQDAITDPDFEEKIKELIELVGQLEKLMIRIISLTGWVIILIKIIS